MKEKLASYDHPSVARFTRLARATWPKPDWQIVHLSNGAAGINDRVHSDYIKSVPRAYATAPWIEIEARRKDEAIAAVPDEYVDERCLVGPVGRIRERYGAWADSGITSLGLTTRDPHALELLTECAREHPARGVDAVTTG